MTFVRVTQDDIADVRSFLQTHSESAMFPLSNLAKYGLDAESDLAPRMWRRRGGPISDVLSVTKAGMVMPYLPNGDFEAAAQVLSGRSLIGCIGPALSARGLQSALGLSDAEMELDSDEAHFALDLDALTIPHGGTFVAPADESHRTILTEWLVDYQVSVLGVPPEAAAKSTPDRITLEIAENRRVVLMEGDTPVATTAFNATLPEIVQIGGVYTPPANRGKGHARRAVALHLEHAKARGIHKATLFASSPSAIAAYSSVGFEQIGDWTLAIFKTPQVAP